MSTFIQNQNWRYATKKFDANKKINASDLVFLKEAVRLSTSSYGLQPYKIIIVENPAIKAKLLPVSWGQSQIVDASHLMVFANETNIGTPAIDKYFDDLATARQIPIAALQGYKKFMTSKITTLPEENRNTWTEKQTYLALGNLINAAAELHIDVCPMEGFDAAQYNQILGLENLNLNAALVATIGYRSADDETQHYKKVRKSNEDLFLTL